MKIKYKNYTSELLMYDVIYFRFTFLVHELLLFLSKCQIYFTKLTKKCPNDFIYHHYSCYLSYAFVYVKKKINRSHRFHIYGVMTK